MKRYKLFQTLSSRHDPSNKDRKNFFVIARGSAFEYKAIMEFLVDTKEIDQSTFTDYENRLDEISRMLFSLIRKLKKRINLKITF